MFFRCIHWLKRRLGYRPRPRPGYRPRLEGLEDRLVPAFNLTIGTAATAGVLHDPAAGTFIAQAHGANINDADIRADLLAGKSVTVSDGNTGNEAGTINWLAGANLDYHGIGTADLTLTVATDPSAINATLTLNGAIFNSKIVTTTESLNVRFSATGDVVINQGSHANVGSFTLAADTLPDGRGDDGVGDLFLNTDISGGSVTLRGADIHIGGGNGTAVASRHTTTLGPDLNQPAGLALGPDGNFYVANTLDGTVSKVTPQGKVTAFASGFQQPSGLAFDPAGNLFVANHTAGTVSKVTPAGTVTTLVSGLSDPTGLAFDAQGNLFIANAGGTVDRVTPGGQTITSFVTGLTGAEALAIDPGGNVYVARFPGTVTRVSPDGQTTIPYATGLNFPGGLALDGAGNLYVSNLFGGALAGTISKVTAPGQMTTYASGLLAPWGLAFDNTTGNLFVAGVTNAVFKVAPGGTVSAVASGLSQPFGMVRDAQGNFFVANATGTVSEVTPDGQISTFASGFRLPTGLAIDTAGNLYVADNGNNQVVRLSPDGKTRTPFGSGYAQPFGLAFDRAGNLYVSNGDGTVDRVTPDGKAVSLFASGFNNPLGLAFDAQGNLYVADGNGVTRLTPDGKTVAVYAIPGGPSGLAFDPQGNLFVTSPAGGTVSELTPDGQVTTFASGLPIPEGVAVDDQGSVFVVSVNSSSISWLSPATLTVRSSLPGRPISVGGADNAVTGVNLTDDELARLHAVNFVFGDNGQAGDITFVTAALTAPVTALQDPAGPGTILLDEAGPASALVTSGASVRLASGGGGVRLLNVAANVLGVDVGTGTLYLSSGGSVGFPSVGQTLTVRAGRLGPGAVAGGVFLSDVAGLTTTGPLTAVAFELFLAGDFTTHAGDLAGSPGPNLVFNGPGDQILESGGQTFENVSHVGGGTLRLVNSPLIVTTDLINASGGDFDANGQAVTAGRLTAGGGTTYRAGAAPQVFTGGAQIIGRFEGGSGPVTVGGLILHAGGSLLAPSTTLTDTGVWTNEGGTFDANGGTVLLAGTHQALSGSTTFFNFTKVSTAADTLTFQAGSTQTVSGLLTLRGAAGTLLALRSSTPGLGWNLDPRGGRVVSAVDVQDSTDLNAAPLVPNGAVDSGDNHNWQFPSVSGFSVSATAGVALAFNPADFAAHYADPAGNALTLVRLDTLSAHGTLTLAGVPVSAGQQVAGALLAQLAYTPGAGFVGQDGFTWSGSQGVAFTAAPATITLTITLSIAAPVVTAPVVAGTPVALTVVPRFTVGAYDPLLGNWYLRDANSAGGPTAGKFQFGGFGPSGFADGLVGDWTGSGQSTPAVFYPASGTWFLRTSNGPTNALVVPPFQFGGPTCIPLAGDWFHTGHFDVGVYDVSTGNFILRHGLNSGAVTVFQLGAPAFGPFYPVAGDFTGSGTWTVGVVQLSTMTWFLKTSNTPGGANLVFQWGQQNPVGSAFVLPVVGDWIGQGKSGIGLVVPVQNQSASPLNNQNLVLLRNEISAGLADAAIFAFGAPGWTPVAGHWQPPTNPLSFQLAQGQGAGTAAITQAQLDAAVAAALARLQQAGVSAGELARLASASYQLAALPAGQLGYTTASQDLVQVSADAAGHGWFVDPTPGQDEEFSGGLAWAGGPAAGKEDLLTVVLHEMAHLVGVNDGGSGLMAEVLPEGTRRTDALDAVFANAVWLSS